MPIVPFEQQKQNTESDISHPLMPNDTHAPENHSGGSARMELAQAVRKEVSEKGYLTNEFLDNFAATHFDLQQQKDSPALWDYATLRQATQQEQKQAQHEENTEALEQEGSWMVQVGALAPDAITLKDYLEVQIPTYLLRMQEAGIPKEQATQVVKNLRAKTVEKNLLNLLSGGDWQTAQEVLSQQKTVLTEDTQRLYGEKIRRVFAGFEAKRLWQQAQGSTSRADAGREARALALVQEPDESLRDEITREITCLAQEEKRQSNVKKAAVFTQLAEADEIAAQQILDAQSVFDEQDTQLARQAAGSVHNHANLKQQKWFVEHFLKAAEVDPAQAFSKGLCGARDYFRLQAARLQEGTGTTNDKWICRSIANWMSKQGFSAQDITAASYEVLTGAPDSTGRAERWKTIKTLLTC